MPLLIGTLVSTFFGLDTLFGTSEIGFFEGVTGFFAYALPYTAMYILMALIAPKFRELNSNTLSDIMAENYGQTARIVSALASFFYSTMPWKLWAWALFLPSSLKFPTGRRCFWQR